MFETKSPQTDFQKISILILLFSFVSIVAISQSNFKVKVTSLSGKPVIGATVSLLNTSFKDISDSIGHVTFNNIPEGKYEIAISSLGYATSLNAITISAKSNLNEIQIIKLADALVQLEDVIITAQKKEELLQKVPFSITAFNSTQIEKFRFWNNKDISGFVPNLYSADPGDNRDVVSIRGITTTSYDPAVATYIDGVNQFNLDSYIPALNDIERIEVLRGPQGSLYGRNAMGGVINIITKQPSNKVTGSAEVNVGNYGIRRYNANFKSPIIKDKLFFGAALLYNDRNGFYTNDFNKSSYDKQYAFGGNYFVKYIATGHWQATLNVKHYSSENKGAFPLVFGVEEAFSNPFRLNQNGITTMMDNTLNTSLAIQHTGRKVNFSSITAYQKNYRYYDLPIDGDFSPIDAISVVNNYGKTWNNIKAYTQEFKWSSSPITTNRFNWTAGAYLFYQDAPVKQGTRFGKDANLMMIGDSLFTLMNSTSTTKKGIAFFGQATYALTSQLNITFGLRNDYEQQDQTVAGYYQHDPSPEFYQIVADTSASINFNAWSPKISLDYNLNTASIIYAMYSKGYRTGGLSPLGSDPSQPPLIGYLPEHSNNFEAGIKNTWLNNTLKLNISLFYINIKDAQVPTLVLPDAITIIKNSGVLNSKGIEAEIMYTPAKGIMIQYNGGITNAIIEATGKRPLFTPDNSNAIAIQYSKTINPKVSGFIRSETKLIGNTYFDSSNEIKQSPYCINNFSMGVNKNKVSIVLWSKNILNQKYISYAYDFGAVHLGDPATYGISISSKF
ncbi:MAG: TonB-dependent receptor [Sediminibacterium sp.]|nr:TonB-dependent receptor [Sediminibacterium sp.]